MLLDEYNVHHMYFALEKLIPMLHNYLELLAFKVFIYKAHLIYNTRMFYYVSLFTRKGLMLCVFKKF